MTATLRRRHASALLVAAPWLLPHAIANPIAPASASAPASAGAAAAAAVPPEVMAALPGARLQGGGRFRYFGFSLYDIALWTTGQRAGDDWAAVPLALSLVYARGFSGAAVADRSLQEMQRQAPVADAQAARWRADMVAAFPNVEPGDRLTGVQRPGDGSHFFHNGTATGSVRDAEFTRRFFGIWLAGSTREPALRDALLGNPR